MKELTNIYTLSCPESGLVRYVGKTDVPNHRYARHCRTDLNETSKKVSWVKNLDKKGLKPIMDIIDVVPWCDWKFWEKHYIQLYKSMGAKLVNSTDGGDGGMTLEAREKLSKLFSGKDFLNKEQRFNANKNLTDYIKKNGVWNKGKRYTLTLTEEDRIAKSKSQIGRHGGKPVLQYDLQGNFIKEWHSAYQIQKQIGITFKEVSACCTGRIKSSKGFHWKFKNGEIELSIPPILTHQKGKKVYQYNLDMTLIKEFNSPKEASEALGINLKGISSSCLSDKTYMGYIWKY